MNGEQPGVTVVLCTRNRGPSFAATLDSLLAMEPPADAILVIDQSDDPHSRDAMAALCDVGTARVRYTRQDAVGLARARNLGLAESPTDLVAFTDDDCTVPVDFVDTLRSAATRWPTAGLLFGSVRAGPHDERAGLIPCTGRDAPFVAHRVAQQAELGAMGACMVLRRSALPAAHGFDPCLGAGSAFHAAEDTDLILRALELGIAVVETPSMHVVHHGFRSWDDVRVLADHYLFGTAAVYAKHMRRHPLDMSVLLARVAVRWWRGTSRVTYFAAHSPRGPRLAAFVRGFARGWRTRIDRRTGHFLDGHP